MPTYEYQCDQAPSHNWEAVQRMADPPLTVCPTCQGPARRLISRTSFKLKGSGWAGDNYGTPAPASSPAPTSPSGHSTSAIESMTSCPATTPTTTKGD